MVSELTDITADINKYIAPQHHPMSRNLNLVYSASTSMHSRRILMNLVLERKKEFEISPVSVSDFQWWLHDRKSRMKRRAKRPFECIRQPKMYSMPASRTCQPHSSNLYTPAVHVSSTFDVNTMPVHPSTLFFYLLFIVVGVLAQAGGTFSGLPTKIYGVNLGSW